MGIEQFLTSADKLESLKKVQKLIAVELYSICLRAAIDPDLFDYETYTPPVDYRQRPYLEELFRQTNAMRTIKQKIEELENAS